MPPKILLSLGSKNQPAKIEVFFSKNVHMNEQMEISEALNIEATNELGMYLGMSTITTSDHKLVG